MKWATPNPMRLAEAAAAADPRIAWVAGLAETWAPILYAAGARGFTSGLIKRLARAVGGDPRPSPPRTSPAPRASSPA